MSLLLHSVTFRPATPEDIPLCLEIEERSYPSDEAASLSSLVYRQEYAPDFFRCAIVEGKVVGFVCATRCAAFDHESMSTHNAEGPLLAIHSVVVQEEFRRQGVATKMLRDYIATVEAMQDGGVETMVLMAKNHLLGFYVKAGFAVLRLSDIVHGQEPWFHLERSVVKNKLLNCWTVDSFAETAGQGNPAGVVLLPKEIDDREWMETVAKEYNLSETAFIWPLEGSSEHEVRYRIRFFTPDGTEVDLCGHATLAAAAVLFGRLENSVKTVVFSANKDDLRVQTLPQKDNGKAKNAQRSLLSMEFPRKELNEVTAKEGIVAMMQSAFPNLDHDTLDENMLYVGLDEDGGDLLIELTPEVFDKLGYTKIQFDAFVSYEGYSRGIMVCAVSQDSSYDFVSRFFGPKAGINEDPVTGSAHCTLAPYFGAKLGKDRVVGRQTSQRGGTVECTVQGESVTIVGSAVATMRGQLLVKPQLDS